jgi:hypothetical protein
LEKQIAIAKAIMKIVVFVPILFTLGINILFTNLATANSSEASSTELAKELANPLAALISVPMQINYDQDLGVDDTGDRYIMNFQPVVPISLSEDWNLISRTIVPVVTQDEISAGSGRQTGLGDTIESLWFSPVKPTEKGWIWGVGPAILVPTATDDLLGGKKWGLGPTLIGLKQNGPWTFGGLMNHIWSVAGSDSRDDISSTFFNLLFPTTPRPL